MAKIGLLGGTFDPVHYAHLFMGQLCLDSLGLEKVIFIPVGVAPHKSVVATDALRRYEMIKLAVAGNARFEASDYETKKPTPSYSVETVEHFKALYPDDELVFIFGEDSLDYVERWYRAADLLRLCSFAVIGRGGFTSDIERKIAFLKERFGAVVYYVHSPELEISSGIIRDMIREGKSARYLLPDLVLAFINEHGMYRE